MEHVANRKVAAIMQRSCEVLGTSTLPKVGKTIFYVGPRSHSILRVGLQNAVPHCVANGQRVAGTSSKSSRVVLPLYTRSLDKFSFAQLKTPLNRGAKQEDT